MADPVAVISYSTTPIPFASLPTNVVMTSGSSTPGTGASSITGWQWYLLDKPTGSSASLLNDTTDTCTLQNVDLPGNYRVFLIVTDDQAQVSFNSPTAKQATSHPYNFTTPNASAFATIRATTRYLALEKMAYGERTWLASSYWPLVDAVDQLKRDLDAITVPTTPRTRYIMAQDGDADADGSPGKPYNPVSAAANSFAGPWQQAITELEALDISDVPGAPRTIVALGTLDNLSTSLSDAYDEDVVITADGPWNIFFTGPALLATGRKFTYTVSASLEAPPNLYIGGMGGVGVASSIFYSPTIELKDAVGSSWFMRWEGVAASNVVVLDSFVAGAFAYLRNCVIPTFNVPNLAIYTADFCDFATALTVKQINKAFRTRFGDVTVTTVVSDGGIVDCVFDAWFIGDQEEYDFAAVWNGPAGSAQFCPITAERFEVAGGTYGSSASADDHLNLSGRRIRAKQELRTPAIYDNGGDGNLGISADGSIALTPAADAVINAGADVSITAAGSLDLEAAEANTLADVINNTAVFGFKVNAATSVLLNATFTNDGGDVLVTYSGHSVPNGCLVFVENSTNYNGVFEVSDGDATTFKLKLVTDGTYLPYVSDRTGDVYRGSFDVSGNAGLVEARGLVCRTSQGSMVLQSADFMLLKALNGRLMMQSAGAGRSIEVETSDGDVILSSAGTDRHVVARGGSGSDLRTDVIERDTDNGGVIVQGRGTHGYDLKADIIESNLVSVRADGAAGTSGRAVVAIASDSTETTPAGTTLETLKTYTLAANTFTTDGAKLLGKAYFETAANANNKRMYIYVNGGAVATLDETDAPFNNTWVRFEFELWKTDGSNEIRFWWKASWGTGKSTVSRVEQLRVAAALTLSSSITIEIRAHAPTTNTDVKYVASDLAMAVGLVGA